MVERRVYVGMQDLEIEEKSFSTNCILRSMGKCVEAVGDFDRAIELAPTEPDPNLGRGVARECLGKFEEAIQVGGWVVGGWVGTLRPRVDLFN